MKMSVQNIVDNYRLRQELAKILSIAVPSNDFRGYENHKKKLQNCCSNSKEYQIAIKCLIDIMEI